MAEPPGTPSPPLGFCRAGLPGARARLADYLDQRAGSVADEPATARMLAAFLLRALRCGAVEESELGVPVGELSALL